jgi:hypothetical protein
MDKEKLYLELIVDNVPVYKDTMTAAPDWETIYFDAPIDRAQKAKHVLTFKLSRVQITEH